MCYSKMLQTFGLNILFLNVKRVGTTLLYDALTENFISYQPTVTMKFPAQDTSDHKLGFDEQSVSQNDHRNFVAMQSVIFIMLFSLQIIIMQGGNMCKLRGPCCFLRLTGRPGVGVSVQLTNSTVHHSRYGPPTRTQWRVIVENLSSRVSWQVCKHLCDSHLVCGQLTGAAVCH